MKPQPSLTVCLAFALALSAHASSGNQSPASDKARRSVAAVQPAAPATAQAQAVGETHAAVQVAQQDGAQPAAQSSATAASEPFSVEKAVQTCNTCHGPDGNSALPETPSLAGQTARYIYLQLKDFKEKRRENPLMSPMAANLDKPQMLALAQYYAEKKLKPNDFKADAGKIKHGKAKADEVLCTMCHLGGFMGQNEIPRVAGQRYDYIVKQLKDFRAMKRTNDAGNMTSVSKTLKDEDIEALAHYITNIN
jgi:cytochrome c553